MYKEEEEEEEEEEEGQGLIFLFFFFIILYKLIKKTQMPLILSKLTAKMDGRARLKLGQ